MSTYKCTSVEQCQEYLDKAKDWFENQNPGRMFTSYPSTTLSAIGEYLANQDGYTLYEHAEGKPINK